MCGIAGIFSPRVHNRENLLSIADGIQKSLYHRGPDMHAIWQDEETCLTFIHRRLSIIDLSADGAQPMHSFSGRYCIVFNGEIYNFQQLREELSSHHIPYKGHSDTEVLLACVEIWGLEKTLKKINGMFAFALYDRKEKTIHFARDRFGKKPLYIGYAGDDLVFSSELKAFHCHPYFQKQISEEALTVYMRYGYVQAPYSIFKQVWQLLPAHYLTISLTQYSTAHLPEKMKSFWSLRQAMESGQTRLGNDPDEVAIDRFEAKLERAVKERMMADVPMGAFLSGGIDSSSVVALMQKNSKAPVRTFSVGFDQKEFNEAEYAKAIAKHLGTDHTELYCSDKDALDVIPKLPQIYDEPFADESQIPTYMISAMARKHVTVVLTGDGGDEILAGYDRHTKIPMMWNKMSWMPSGMRSALCYGLSLVPENIYTTLRASPLLQEKIKRSLQVLRQDTAENAYDYLLSIRQDTKAIVKNHAAATIPLHNTAEFPERINFLNRMIFSDLLSYRSDDLMVKSDRAAMAASIEARAPLMDYHLAEYSFMLPDSMKVRHGKGKWILRQVLKRYVPEALYERPKMGFSLPVNQWLKTGGALNAWANDLLTKEALDGHGLLNSQEVISQWQSFQTSPTAFKNRRDIWSLLMFQQWYKEWIE